MPVSQPSRRRFLAGAGAAAAAAVTTPLWASRAAAAPTTYTASWASVDQHPPAPAWFQDAKFGIYFHWGVFSVPAYGNEWYPRRMYISGDACYNQHLSVYGSYTAWPYNYFISGANNKAGVFTKFQPKLTSAGGNFDPEEWAQLIAGAGAKFAGPVAEHHDGFSMYNSSVNEWNSVGMGPKLDLLQLHSQAIRGQGLKLLVAMHHAYHFNGYYDHVPPQPTSSLRTLYAQHGSTIENQLWYAKLQEVIDQAQPDILWQDFDLIKVDETQRLNFLAYYYNQAISWGKDVVATYKDGFDTAGEVFDFERGGPAGLLSPYWLTDDAVSPQSWCYTTGMTYYDSTAILHSIIDRVSKGGNSLLNISPTWDGTIPQAQRDILTVLGNYFRPFGASFYATRAWSVYGEGPTQMGGGSFTGPKAGTNKDIRFTRNTASTVLYATVLGWPGNGAALTIASLGSGHISLGTLQGVQLLGSSAGQFINLPTHSQDSAGLHITLPNQPFAAPAYVVKLTFSGQIPAYH